MRSQRIVVADASAVAEHLLQPTPTSPLARTLVDQGAQIATPHLCDAEILSALRSLTLRGRLCAEDAGARLRLYARMPVRRFEHGPLLVRSFEHRHNLSAYDALYVALAESLEAPLLTADRRLRAAVGRFTSVSLVEV